MSASENVSNNYPKEDQDLVKLLQQLIRIPSWVEKTPQGEALRGENDLVVFLKDWLTNNTKMAVWEQKLESGQTNLLAQIGKPKLIYLAHTDTVAPTDKAPYPQLEAEIHDEKIWGRGSTDMKSGIASMIQALALTPDVSNTWLMLYADEEYDFKGMKGLINEFKNLKPDFLVSSDGSDLKIGHGCRGLMEIKGLVRGQRGHAAKGNGLNALEGTYQAVEQLKKYLQGYEHPVMGPASLNLAYVLGGTELSQDDSFPDGKNLIRVGKEGNVIPDIAEFIVDIRPPDPDLTTSGIIQELQVSLSKKGYKYSTSNIRHNLGAWYTPKSDISPFVKLAEEVLGGAIEFDIPGKSGYLDLQMLWEATGRPTSIMFGGGEGNTAHRPDEHIKISALIKTRNFFRKILEKHSKSELQNCKFQ